MLRFPCLCVIPADALHPQKPVWRRRERSGTATSGCRAKPLVAAGAARMPGHEPPLMYDFLYTS
eukprot:15364538-Ditylum_brightwellii.AAC.4